MLHAAQVLTSTTTSSRRCGASGRLFADKPPCLFKRLRPPSSSRAAPVPAAMKHDGSVQLPLAVASMALLAALAPAASWADTTWTTVHRAVPWWQTSDFLIALGVAVFTVQTLVRMYQERRPVEALPGLTVAQAEGFRDMTEQSRHSAAMAALRDAVLAAYATSHLSIMLKDCSAAMASLLPSVFSRDSMYADYVCQVPSASGTAGGTSRALPVPGWDGDDDNWATELVQEQLCTVLREQQAADDDDRVLQPAQVEMVQSALAMHVAETAAWHEICWVVEMARLGSTADEFAASATTVEMQNKIAEANSQWR